MTNTHPSSLGQDAATSIAEAPSTPQFALTYLKIIFEMFAGLLACLLERDATMDKTVTRASDELGKREDSKSTPSWIHNLA